MNGFLYLARVLANAATVLFRKVDAVIQRKPDIAGRELRMTPYRQRLVRQNRPGRLRRSVRPVAAA